MPPFWGLSFWIISTAYSTLEFLADRNNFTTTFKIEVVLNVRCKQTAAVEWVKKINALPAEKRMNREWEYVLLSEDDFYGLAANNATLTDICDRCKVSQSSIEGNLFA